MVRFGGELGLLFVKSWVAFVNAAEPGDAFYGYTGPGYREEFWIIDVDGTASSVDSLVVRIERRKERVEGVLLGGRYRSEWIERGTRRSSSSDSST